MSPDELKRRFPSIPHILALYEEDRWGQLFEAFHVAGRSAEEVVKLLVAKARLALKLVPGEPLQSALPEMLHPQFVEYIRYKMEGRR